MSKQYAAMKMKMGSWEYYSVKMRMDEIASEVSFAKDVTDDNTLDTENQRQLNESRAATNIVNYLVNNEQRFFNSIVVAALGGNPKFYPVSLENRPEFMLAQHTAEDTFGILMFNNDVATYALDGQHRLSAIKKIINGDGDVTAPTNFSAETLNVIFVLPQDDQNRPEFLKSYRRLFSALNRHAKPMDKVTIIIMDEDDRFAMVTRRLFADFDFFSWDGQEGSPRIDAKSTSKSISPTSPALSNLICLYEMNKKILWDPEMQAEFGPDKTNNFVYQKAPTEDELNSLYNYLEKIWDALVQTLPVLGEDPVRMRRGGADGTGSEDDNLLFRPMGQTNILAPICRSLMNKSEINADSTTDQIKLALAPLKHVPWSLQNDVWRELLTIVDPTTGLWKMRNEDSAKVEAIARSVLTWLCHLQDLDEEQLDELQEKWAGYLIPPGNNEREDHTFETLRDIRELIASEF